MRYMIEMAVVVLLLAGPTRAWAPDQYTWGAPWSWTGAIAESELGLAVSSGGDLNGDGIDDMVFAAPYDSSGGPRLGRVFVVFGTAQGWQPELDIAAWANASFVGEAEDDHPGGDDAGGSSGVAIVPSVNGDAYDDIVIVSPDNSVAGAGFGKCYIVFGKPTGQWQQGVSLSSADVAFVGEQNAGSACVAPAGDVNNDGRGDFLIGISGVFPGSYGKTYLFLGRDNWPTTTLGISQVADASFVGEQNGSQAGTSVAGIQDLNGDGRDEIAIGAPKHTPAGVMFAGKVYIIFGRATGWSLNESLANADRSIVGDAAEDLLGWRVCGAGDVDNDGTGDLLVSTSNASENGRICLFLGSSLVASAPGIPASSADTQILGAYYTTGDALARLGDVNLDGYDDIAIGAPLFDNGVGKAYALFGMQTWPATLDIGSSEGSWRGVSGKFWAGCSVAGGDVDGDGSPDMIIGAAADPLAGYDAGAVFVMPSTYAPGADGVPPAPVTVFQAQVNPEESTAAIQWSPVSLDQNGNPEQIMFYRVVRYSYYRWLDEPPEIDFAGMFPAVTAAPYTVVDLSWAPWEEVASASPPIHSLSYYFYQIYAIDTTGNISAPSAWFTVFQTETNIP